MCWQVDIFRLSAHQPGLVLCVGSNVILQIKPSLRILQFADPLSVLLLPRINFYFCLEQQYSQLRKKKKLMVPRLPLQIHVTTRCHLAGDTGVGGSSMSSFGKLCLPDLETTPFHSFFLPWTETGSWRRRTTLPLIVWPQFRRTPP